MQLYKVLKHSFTNFADLYANAEMRRMLAIMLQGSTPKKRASATTIANTRGNVGVPTLHPKPNDYESWRATLGDGLNKLFSQFPM